MGRCLLTWGILAAWGVAGMLPIQGAEAVGVAHQLTVDRSRGYERQQNLYTFTNGGAVAYQLIYSVIADPAYLQVSPGARLPVLGDSTTRSTGLGLNHAWYQNGFLRIEIGGRPLTELARLSPFAGGGQAGLALTWPEHPASVSVTVLKKDFADHLLLEIGRQEESGGDLAVTLLARPGHSRSANRRWVSTATRHYDLAEHPQGVSWPSSAYWLLAYDLEDNNRHGCAAILFDPEDFASEVKVQARGTLCSIGLQLKPGRRRGRLMLWSFPERYMEAESAYDYLSGKHQRLLEELRQTDFAARP